MTDAQRERVDELFGELYDLDAAAQADALAGVDDAEVRAEVGSLLEHNAVDAGGLGTSIGNLMQAATDSGAFEDRAIGPGTRFERYRIERKLGQGGMGDVYEATRDNDFHKQVALKIVRYGLDSEFARARFQQERQTLAGLEHPYIARLIDGGEAGNGCPYLVLEFVDGLAIDEYVRGCTRDDILSLFLKVCEAVEYAHRNLIIHRDLKPANILVTADGTPKLLDFGIAKLLDANADVTQTMAVALTPQYASPEQIRGLPITTASDVYSLGVVLYQLLTQRKPYRIDTTTAVELDRIVCEQAPAAPALGNELDDILLMALRKEPERRYTSVTAFAQDIERFTNGRPVLAAPDTFRYRARKYVGRHWAGLAAVATVILVLVGGLASTLYQKRQADRRFQQVRSLANTFLFDFENKIRLIPGSTEAREMIVTTALKYLDGLSKEAGSDPGLLSELESAYLRTGDVQGNPTGASLGHADAAMQSYRKAVDIGERLRAGRAPDPVALNTLGTAYYRIAMLHINAGNSKEAIPLLDKGLQLAAETRSRGRDAHVLVVRCESGLAYAQSAIGNSQAALEATQRALQAQMDFAKLHPDEITDQSIATIRTQLGTAMASRGDLSGALDQQQIALRMMQPYVDKGSRQKGVNRFQGVAAAAYAAAGSVSGGALEPNLEKRPESILFLSKAVALYELLSAEDPKDSTARFELGTAWAALGMTLSETDPAGGRDNLAKAIAVAQELVATAPKDGANQFLLEQAYFGMGRLSIRQGRIVDGRAALSRALQIQESASATNTEESQRTRLKAQILTAFATPESLEQARLIAERMWQQHPQDFRMLVTLADAYESSGSLACTAKNRDEAAAWYLRSRDLWLSWPRHGTSTAFDVQHAERAAKAASFCQGDQRKLASRARKNF